MGLLLQYGADCLLPTDRRQGSGLSVVADFASCAETHSAAAVIFAHLERQRAAGRLDLGSSAERPTQLLLAAVISGTTRSC